MNHLLWILYGAQVGATFGFFIWAWPHVLKTGDGDGDK